MKFKLRPSSFFFACLCSWLVTELAHGYEFMLMKGYSSCVACHRSPQGGGLLTDYGKMVSASMSTFGPKDYREGAFKKAIRVGGRLDHAIQARLANIKSDLSNETFPMQADYLLAFSDQKWQVLSQLARAPKRRNQSDSVQEPSTIETMYFREFRVLYSLANDKFLSVGRERQNLGFRLDDHTIYNKSLNRFNVADLASVASFTQVRAQAQYSVALFLPSYQERAENSETGLKLEGRHLLMPKLQLGAGVLAAQAQAVDRVVVNVLAKLALGRWMVSAESMLTRRKNAQDMYFNQQSHYAQLAFYPWDALELSSYGELVRRDLPFELDEERFGFGFNWRMLANVALRTDAKRSFRSQKNEDLIISQLFFNWW